MDQPDDRSNLPSVLEFLANNGGVVGQFIGKEAAKALSSLVGSALKVPDAYFSGIATGITSDANAKAKIKEMLAAEIGRKASVDDALIDRMARRWLGDQIGKQLNREAVAVEAVADLGESPAPEDAAIDDEFLARFSAYAENATTEQMQKLFGRVLAGEIRKPGTFSLATLHTLSMIDQKVAKAVEEAAPWVLSGFLPTGGAFASGEKFAIASILEEAGLCYSPASRTRDLKPQDGVIVLAFESRHGSPVLYINTDKPSFQPVITPITTVGKQVFGLITPARSPEDLREVAVALAETHGVTSVELGSATMRDGNLLANRIGPFDPPVANAT